MFVILSYDVISKHDTKVMKICRRYLTHRHYSVFEGIITEAKLNKLKEEIIKSIDTEVDSICIYEFESLRYSSKEVIGPAGADDNII